MIKIDFKKIVLTAALVIGTVVVLPQTIEAKTKAIIYNIDNKSVNEICKDIQLKGKTAHLLEEDKNTYKIVLQTKAKSSSEGRKKINSFAKKLMNCDANTYGLSYGVRPDDYNSESYNKKKKVYTTKLCNTANDIYWLNKIVNEALNEQYYPYESFSVRKVFPTDESFKKSSQAVKTQFILRFMGEDFRCMDYSDKVNTFTWKKAYEGKNRGVCLDFAYMYEKAVRLVANDYEVQQERNSKANHAMVIMKVKNSKDDYDFFEGNNEGFGNYIVNVDYSKQIGIPRNYQVIFSDLQVNAPKEYRVSKLEKDAYNYGIKKTVSELDTKVKNL